MISGHGPIFQHRLQDVFCPPHENQVVLQCKVIASPRPALRWFHNDVPIVADEDHELSFQNNWAKLIVKSVFFSDAGIYKCFAQNEFGYSACSCRLLMADIPEKPGRPEVRLASDSEVLVVWEAPVRTDGLDIINYCLEYRRAGEGEWSCPWFTVSNSLDSEAVIIKRLEPLGIYQFRVFVRNSYGLSEPSLSSRIIQTHPRGECVNAHRLLLDVKRALKLNLEILKNDYVLNVVNLPQSGCLGDIPEDEGEGDTEGSHSNFTSCSASPVLKNSTDIIDMDPSCRFQLESVIFRGRFCIIRNAVDKLRESSSHCVAKILSDKPEFAEMSFRECEVLRLLRHRSIVEFIAAYRNGGHLIIFMERLHDGLFDRFTFDDYYTEEVIAKVMVQIISALQWMHFQRYVKN
ncbi:unnamed protein product [Soboliphyme baturini]|uniref:Receptor protein-tyrosine kinase n=1 Tax=Soboliphyme baturini TaxID=241478 RepID=A0A183J652_9BILA|nr:unnamed protein product [Soboliphyme baturini]